MPRCYASGPIVLPIVFEFMFLVFFHRHAEKCIFANSRIFEFEFVVKIHTICENITFLRIFSISCEIITVDYPAISWHELDNHVSFLFGGIYLTMPNPNRLCFPFNQ